MEQIYFSDNFFFLRNRIQVLQELLDLDINEEIFNAQIMEEVRNITHLLIEHEILLNKRNQLQNYAELVHQLFRIKRALLLFLRNAESSPKKFLQTLVQRNNNEWRQIITRISDGNAKLIEEFRNKGEEYNSEKAIVSDAELELLFQNSQELGID